MASTIEFSRQSFRDFLKSSDEIVAKAVAFSDGMRTDLERFGDIKQSLADAVNVKTADVHFYGSRLIGTASAGSDLNIYVDIDNCFKDGIGSDKQRIHLIELMNKLHLKKEWEVEAVISGAVPILHLVYVPRSIKCE